MAEFEYLDKRDEDGLILTYSAFGLAHDVALRSFDSIQGYGIYKLLVETLPEKYVEIYFKRLFYHSFLPIAHQIVLYDWHIRNCEPPPKELINVNSFPSLELLNLVWPSDSVQFASVIRSRDLKLNFYNIIRRIYHKALEWEIIFGSIFFPKSQIKYNLYSNEENVIAVNYVEGVNKNKRSDLFWLKNSGIQPSSVLIYIQSSQRLSHHDNPKKEINRMKKYGVNWIKRWKWNSPSKVDFIDLLRNKINKINYTDPIEKWLFCCVQTLIKDVEYWFLFFDEFNVRIHLDPTIGSSESITKQIALTKLGGCSIGRIRSYIKKFKGSVFAGYTNNSFFAMGEHSLAELKNTENKIDNILISGNPFATQSEKVTKEISTIKDNLNIRGAKFTILLFDSNHSLNKGLTQSMGTSALETFYKLFLNWLIDDNDIGLIIKSKKPVVLDTLPSINDLLQKAVETGRCHVVDNPFQIIPANYASISNITIATGIFFSSALMECVSTGAKGVFYDYPNLRSIETELYSWGDNKVIFSDIFKMIQELKAYKKDSRNNPDLGDWSEHLEKIDPFRDGRGGERIGTYISWLQKGFENGLECSANIGLANQKYAEAWGGDKLSS